MNTAEESVVMAMDGTSSQLFPFLPYIVQDLWEIGSSPEVILKLVKKYMTDYPNFKVLDLGCGKGVISIQLAKEFKCYCHGVDAVKEFINEAKTKAKEFDVEEYCYFECDDIRLQITDLKDYDIVILGSIGPVFGDYYSTLTQVSKCIKEKGIVIIDDGYIDDESEFSHPLAEKKSVILKQISDAQMTLTDEIIIDKDEIIESDEYIYKNIKRRCQELIEKYPEKKNLFMDYIKKQEDENEALERKIICSTMLFRKCL